jgi:hypothetical protein
MVKVLPKDALDAERFYRNLQAFCIAAKNGSPDPWASISWGMPNEHAEMIAKLISNHPDHRTEVMEYLQECLRLAVETEKHKAKILPFYRNRHAG